MPINCREDLEYLKEMGKTYFRLVEESSKLPTDLARQEYIRKGMKRIYTDYELNEFYENMGRLANQSAILH